MPRPSALTVFDWTDLTFNNSMMHDVEPQQQQQEQQKEQQESSKASVSPVEEQREERRKLNQLRTMALLNHFEGQVAVQRMLQGDGLPRS
jgi:hypothetical protein